MIPGIEPNRPLWPKLLALFLVLVAGVAFVGWYKLFREVPNYYTSDADHFMHGSIGTEGTQGFPYWIWAVLPRMFPEYLPKAGGWSSLGIAWREGDELPSGFTKTIVGIERIGINCAFCHTSSYRKQPGDKPTLVLAGPSHQFTPQRFQRFVWQCAADPRFNPKNMMAEIDRVYKLSWMDHVLYRYVPIRATKKALLKQQNQFAFTYKRPDWGPGRVDPFNPVKYNTLKVSYDETIGNSDIPSIWNQNARPKGYSRHWDGLDPDLTEVMLSSAIGDGTSKKWMNADLKKWDSTSTNPADMSSFRRVENFVRQQPPPKYPFPIDAALAEKGHSTFEKDCASCHEIGKERTGKVIPVGEVGTDRHRLDMWTAEASQAYKDYAKEYSWKFTQFVKTDGYVAVPLDGLWLRAPYLHNGSVPTLVDLLETPENRTKSFYRGYDVYDPVKVGFLSHGGDAEKNGFLFKTDVPANGNQGHNYGTSLSAPEKQALIEYMKTL